MKAVAMKSEHYSSKLAAIEAELKEAKKDLENALQQKLEREKMVAALKEELDRTKKELKQGVKSSETREDVMFVEDEAAARIAHIERPVIGSEKIRCVSFTNLPSLARVMEGETLRRQLLLDRGTETKRRRKKKGLIPLMGVIFSKKKSH